MQSKPSCAVWNNVLMISFPIMSNVADFEKLQAFSSIYLHQIPLNKKKNQAGGVYVNLIRSLSFMYKSLGGLP